MIPKDENLLQNIHDRTVDIQKRLDELQNRYESDLKAIQHDLKVLGMDIAFNLSDGSYRSKNRLIVRFINTLLSNGRSYDDAIMITAGKLQEPPGRCEIIYNTHKQAASVAERRAKNIMIQRLAKLKYPKKEIARIAGYSVKYIYDVLKTRQKIKKR